MPEKKGWGLAVVTAGVGLLGGLIGSTYQQSLTARLERTKVFDENRRSVYIEYLNAMENFRLSEDKEAASKAAQSPEERTQLTAEAVRLRDKWEHEAGTASRKVGIFGASAVIVALANHWREYPDLGSCGRGPWNTDLQLFSAMRKDAMPDELRLSDADLAVVTMRCTPPGN